MAGFYTLPQINGLYGYQGLGIVMSDEWVCVLCKKYKHHRK